MSNPGAHSVSKRRSTAVADWLQWQLLSNDSRNVDPRGIQFETLGDLVRELSVVPVAGVRRNGEGPRLYTDVLDLEFAPEEGFQGIRD